MKAYERWQFASLADEAPVRKAQARATNLNPQQGAPAPQAPVNERPPGPTAAELAAHELAVLRETARADGHTAGFAAGRAEGLAAAQAETDHLRRIAAAMAGALTELQDETAAALLDLAISTARQVLREELRTNPEIMLAGVREAIDLAGGGAVPVLQLNPADIGFVQRHLGDELNPGGWRLAENAHIEPGGCRVTTTNGAIDSTLKTRWARAMSSLGRNDALDVPEAIEAPATVPDADDGTYDRAAYERAAKPNITLPGLE